MFFPQNVNSVSRIFSCKVLCTGLCILHPLEGIRAKANHRHSLATPWFITFISFPCDDNGWGKVSLGQENGKRQHHEGAGMTTCSCGRGRLTGTSNWPLSLRTQTLCKCFRGCIESCSPCFIYFPSHYLLQSISSDLGAQSFDNIS